MLGLIIMKSKPVPTKRPYVQRARARAAAITRQRILDAAAAERWGRRVFDVRLEPIAEAAGVTVQTVLRVFGTKTALLEEAASVLRERVRQQRGSAAPGDVDGTVRALFDHYEAIGDYTVRNLADEEQAPELRQELETGRQMHRESMAHQFAPQLAAHPDAARAQVLDCLVIACDVYTWKLLRRDMRRSRAEAEASVRRLVLGILEGG
jgi:AcrR family transcriptional regulator